MKLHGQQEIRKNGLVTQTPQQTLKHMRLFHFSLELVCVNRRLQAFICNLYCLMHEKLYKCK